MLGYVGLFSSRISTEVVQYVSFPFDSTLSLIGEPNIVASPEIFLSGQHLARNFSYRGSMTLEVFYMYTEAMKKLNIHMKGSQCCVLCTDIPAVLIIAL